MRRQVLAVGDKLPTESEVMAELGVSRTVVREAISKLQAAGLVETRHGIGTFVLDSAAATGFRIAGTDPTTLRDVVAIVELRLGLEVEATALAAQRRSAAELEDIRVALAAFERATAEDGDTVGPDLHFHQGIARATHNPHFVDLMTHLGTTLLPRTRVNMARFAGQNLHDYLRRIHIEHESILSAIANRDSDAARAAMRTHLSNSRDRAVRAQNAADAE